jgi:BlaI family transcriptional regulator, penicillinase repressor
MARKKTPTESETKILSVIWELGTATVRDVYEALSQKEDIGHTTVLKLMQIMTEKGLLRRDTTVRPQVFKPSQPQKRTQRTLINELINSAFRGSTCPLVLQALSMKKTTPEELQEIRQLLDNLEETNNAK